MSFDDELRDTMRAHDTEAPTVADLGPAPWHRTTHRTWWPAAAAAAIVLLATGITLAVRHSGGHQSSAASVANATCPQRYPVKSLSPWVPQRAEGVDAASRLVPDEVPTSVFICGYLGGRAQLTGRRAVTANLRGLREALTWVPAGDRRGAPCTADLQPHDGDNFLIHLTYPSGAMWVSAPGDHCDGSTNGTFSSTANLRASVIPAYETGAWANQPARGKDGRCGVFTQGRLGQEANLVPDHPTTLVICTGSPRQQVTTVSVDAIDRVVTALNALPTIPETYECGPSPDKFYDLAFEYDRGPAVIVNLTPGCQPEIDNGSLQSRSAASIVPLVEQLLNR